MEKINEFDLNYFKDKFKTFSGSEKKKINLIIIEKIGELFTDEQLKRFIVKNLQKEAQHFDLALEIAKIKRGDKEAAKNIKTFILDQYMDFYLSKVSPQMFNKRKITGNRQLDAVLHSHFNVLLSSPAVLSKLEGQLDSLISEKLMNKIKRIKKIQLNEASQLKKNVTDYVYNRRLNKTRIELVENIISYFPNINDNIIKRIHQQIFNLNPDDLNKHVLSYRENPASYVSNIMTSKAIFSLLFFLNENTNDKALQTLLQVISDLYKKEAVKDALYKDIYNMLKNN